MPIGIFADTRDCSIRMPMRRLDWLKRLRLALYFPDAFAVPASAVPNAACHVVTCQYEKSTQQVCWPHFALTVSSLQTERLRLTDSRVTPERR